MIPERTLIGRTVTLQQLAAAVLSGDATEPGCGSANPAPFYPDFAPYVCAHSPTGRLVAWMPELAEDPGMVTFALAKQLRDPMGCLALATGGEPAGASGRG